MRRLVLLILLALAAAPAAAQVRPTPTPGGNPHLQSVKYAEGQVVVLELAPGYQLAVELGSDEQIENVAVGDANAWQVTANKRGDRLFIKAMQSGSPTNMTVITNARLYAFELTPLFSGAANMAYVVKFEYPGEDAEPPADGRRWRGATSLAATRRFVRRGSATTAAIPISNGPRTGRCPPSTASTTPARNPSSTE